MLLCIRELKLLEFPRALYRQRERDRERERGELLGSCSCVLVVALSLCCGEGLARALPKLSSNFMDRNSPKMISGNRVTDFSGNLNETHKP